MNWREVVSIALGAAVGANARYALSLWAAQRWPIGFPVGTVIINVLGSLLIGVLMALFAERLPVSQPVRLLLITGLLGGFTTFSTFSYELYQLLNTGNYGAAATYLLASVGGGLLAATLGIALVRVFWPL